MDNERHAFVREAYVGGEANSGLLLTSIPEMPGMFFFDRNSTQIHLGVSESGPFLRVGKLCCGANENGMGFADSRSPTLAVNLDVASESLEIVVRDLMNRVLKKFSSVSLSEGDRQ